MNSGSTKIAMSRIQLTIASVVNRVKVSKHSPVAPVKSATVLHVADGFSLHSKMLKKNEAILQRMTKTIRIQFV